MACSSSDYRTVSGIDQAGKIEPQDRRIDGNGELCACTVHGRSMDGVWTVRAASRIQERLYGSFSGVAQVKCLHRHWIGFRWQEAIKSPSSHASASAWQVQEQLPGLDAGAGTVRTSERSKATVKDSPRRHCTWGHLPTY